MVFFLDGFQHRNGPFYIFFRVETGRQRLVGQFCRAWTPSIGWRPSLAPLSWLIAGGSVCGLSFRAQRGIPTFATFYGFTERRDWICREPARGGRSPPLGWKLETQNWKL